MEISNIKWSEFDFNNVFHFKRGRRLVRLEQVDGDIAYISSTKNNNGIDNYITPPAFMRIYSNALTLNNSGSVGYCFYHPYNFVCSDHCTVIKIKDSSVILNSYIALFLKPIIESIKVKYNFAREISNYRLDKEKINLPVNDKGTPDWLYMESFLREISNKIVFNKKIRKSNESNDITTSLWTEFSLSYLFEIEKGERLVEIERKSGEVPLLTATSFNNGIASFIDNESFIEDKKLFENKITVDMFCNVFFHNYKYFSDDNVHTFILRKKFETEINKYNGLFLVTSIKQLAYKYGFGRQVRLKRLENEFIKLPSKLIGNEEVPDFEFMENYIKSLPYSNSI